MVNEDSEIMIWVRFQTQFIFDENPEYYTPFMSIKSEISDRQILLKYQYNQQLQVMITTPDQDLSENLITLKGYERQTWIRINLLRDQEFYWIKAQNKTIQLPQFQSKDEKYYGYLLTWQNLTFSLKAHKGIDQKIQSDYFIQNNPILKLYKQIVMNYKSQIQLEMFIRQKYEEEHIVFKIQDQEYDYSLIYGYSNIKIQINTGYQIFEKVYFGIPHNQWFQFRIYFELNKTISKIITVSEQFDWVYENQQIQPIDGYIPQYYGIIVQFFNKQVEIDNIVIFNKRDIQTTNYCFPGCKKCEQLNCLECQNNLELQNQCSCYTYQFYDNQGEICKDITEYPGLIQNKKPIQICQLNEYFNSQQEKCLQCPNIDDYYCTDCVYNTQLWKIYKTCTFQEMYSDIFLKYQSINYDLDQNTFQLIFDHFYTKITNYKCDFEQKNGLILCKRYPWDHLSQDICELGHYNRITHNCTSIKGIFHQFQNRIMCQQNYTIINLKCIKCPNNCVICTYSRKIIKCLITKQGFFIQPNIFLIKRCQQNTTVCVNQMSNLENPYISINQPYCKLQMKEICLLCVDNYILDLKLNCVEGYKISFYYKFEFLTNHFMKLQQDQLQQIQINQNLLIDTKTFQQIMFYGKKYENIKQNQQSNRDQNCMKFIYFNLTQKCIVYKDAFTSLNNEIIYYCPNDYCNYNITINLTILISNRQEVIYKNSTYHNIQDLLDNLQVPIFYSEIIFNVQAFAFDSFDQRCFDHQVFLLNENKKSQHFPNTFFKLIIQFQTFSQFPECWNKNFYSNFDFIEIRNLMTNNKLQIEFHSQQVRLIDCKFSSDIQIVIYASIVFLENIQFFSSIFNNSLLYIINHNQIQEIRFISCKFSNISIYENTILIKILQSALKIILYDLTLFQVVIDESQFIQFQSFKQLDIDQILIAKLDTILATLFSCQQILFDSQIIMVQITIVDSDFWYSNFYQINGQAKIENVRITNSLLQSSQIFNINDKVLFKEILVQGIYLDKSFLINCKNQHANLILKQINIIDSYFNQTSSAISLIANNIKIIQLQIHNCNYYPSLNMLDIKAQNGIIKYLNLTNINIEKQFQQQIVLLPDYLLNLEFENIILIFSVYKNIIIDQVKLLHIQYQTVQIKNFVIKNFSLIGESLNEIIIFSELNEQSNLKLHSLEVNTVNIKWLYLSKLISLQGNYGVYQIQNVEIKNITSTFQHQILFCSRIQLFLINVEAEFQPYVGLLKQYQSKIIIQNYRQQENIKFIQQWNTPIFTNIDPVSDYELFTIFNSTYINLRQPIMRFVHNIGTQLQIRNLNVYSTSSFQDLFVLELENYKNLDKTTIVFNIFIDQVYVQNYYNKLMKLVSCEFSQIRLNQIVLLNTSLTVLYGRFNGLTRIKNIFIINSNLTQQSFFHIRNQNSHFIAEKINMKKQVGKCNIFKFETFSFRRQKQYYIQIRDVFIKNCKDCLNFIQIDNVTNFRIFFTFAQYIIIESNFLEYLFQFVTIDQFQFNLNNFLVYNTQLLSMVSYIEQDIFQQINNMSLINVVTHSIKGNYYFYNSYILNSTLNGQQIVIINNQMVLNSNQKLLQQPIALSFSEFNVFKQQKIIENLYQIYFNTNQTIVYVPSGIPLSRFRYIDPITQLQESPYENFIIVLNTQSQEKIACSLIQSINDQPGNYSNMNHFELQNGVNIIENFTFLMNPYLNYTFIQNDITCSNFTIRFNIRTLPCQLGEYLYLNQCLICDITKNYYSVTKRAQLCNIINQDHIEQLKVGNIKLRPTFWRAKLDSNKIEQCNNAQCLGGWQPGDQSCLIGYVGALCKECDIYDLRGKGKFAYRDSYCQVCEYNNTIFLKGLFVMLWLMILAYLSYDTNKQITQQYLFYKITQRNIAEILMRQSINQVSIIIKIMTNYIFYLYLFRDKLTFLYSQLNISFDLISNPNMIIKPHLDCFLVEFHQLSIQYNQLIYSLISPFYILSIFYLFYLLLLVLRIMKYQFSFIIITIFSVYLFNQQLIFQKQIQLLSSITISNIQWIQLNQQFYFHTKQHSQMLWYFIIPSNLLLILIPVVLLFILKFQDKRSVKTSKYFGIFFKEYRMEKYYWEIIRIFQRYFMILFMHQLRNEYIILYIEVIYGLFIFSQPYPLKNLNRFESQTLYLLTSILIDVLYMTDHSTYIRGTLFCILNSIILKNAIMGIIRGSQLQYKTQLLKLKTAVTQIIPISNRYIKNSRSLSLLISIKNTLYNQKCYIPKEKQS
ncbi:hypothetical protein pb186bvf_014611 [Paramecium bursaria]